MARLIVVGGASGVGKSTLLSAVSNTPQLNTGTFFKNRMAIANRDDVRSGDWSEFEELVASDLASAAMKEFESSETVILDTHFAAKINNRRYRIGLKRPLLSSLAHALFDFADDSGVPMSVNVILVRCSIHSLLRRRRLDKSRSRELIPSDCLRALRENDLYSWQYYHEFLDACPSSDHGVVYEIVENEDFQRAQVTLENTVRR